MELYTYDHQIQQNPHQSDLFEACFIQQVYGALLDDDGNSFSSSRKEELNLTGKAMVGLNVNDVDWLSTERYPISDSIPRDELKNMHFKLKIYACDDMEWLFVG